MTLRGTDPAAERLISRGPEETRRMAARLYRRYGSGTIWALCGDLGSGKTCLVQGLAVALGVREPVCSPTFSLVQEYTGDRPLTHIDLYRLSGPDEVLALGWDEYLETDGIVAVEWAERAAGLFPAGTVWITLQLGATPSERILEARTSEMPT